MTTKPTTISPKVTTSGASTLPKTPQADIHVKVDADVKAQSEDILKQIGLSMSDLVNMTLRRVIRERCIPFSTKLDDPNIPRCMNIKSEAELEEYLQEIIPSEGEDENRAAYTIAEVQERLGLTK